MIYTSFDSFRYSAVPDELLFQTLIGNYVPRSRVRSGPVFVDWTRTPRPYIFTTASELSSIGPDYAFARKFSGKMRQAYEGLTPNQLSNPYLSSANTDNQTLVEGSAAWEQPIRAAFHEACDEGEVILAEALIARSVRYARAASFARCPGWRTKRCWTGWRRAWRRVPGFSIVDVRRSNVSGALTPRPASSRPDTTRTIAPARLISITGVADAAGAAASAGMASVTIGTKSGVANRLLRISRR